ncbi:hypothetical protein LBMAG55_05510 [Verrucomicrobiota bacterium]|nr:hypothetical protein LBMAG55_05510 [Verrucomicrobiota bacterium]
MRTHGLLPGLLLGVLHLSAAPCRLEVTERGTDWPVPGVELRTVHGERLVSDNAGLIAFDLPELLGHEVWAEVHGHGYGVKKDGFGYAGVRFVPRPGTTVRIEVDRTQPARRLGRLTGAGLFAESQKLGEHLDWKESGVLGCDSVVTARFDGKLYWFWGDTNLARYPLGIFNVSAATTDGFTPPTRPPLQVSYDYFRNPAGAPRGVAEVPGDGPTWVWGAATLPDAQGREHLVASAVKVRGNMEAYRWDLVEWDAAAGKFKPLLTFWKKSAEEPKPTKVPDGHALKWTDAGGKPWLLFCNPYPTLRCPATYEAWKDPTTWESLTPDRTVLTTEGKKVEAHGGDLAWHPWSKRWLLLFTQKGGASSFLGEIWLATAPSPTGPWTEARQVATHDNYTFYNPVLHPETFRADSSLLHFEGTYVTTFSNNKQPTPRWDYNQVLYQVDLARPPFGAGK